MKNFWTAQRRQWLYNIATAAVPILTTYGIVTVEQGGVWVILIGAILGTASPALAGQHVVADEETDEPF